MNNRTLLIIFIACLALFLAGSWFRSHRSSSFDPVIAVVDTAKVDRIQFTSNGPQGEAFELKRNGSTWEAVRGDLHVPASNGSVNTILGQLIDLKGSHIVTKDKEKYGAYEITEDQASRVQVWEGKKQTADIVVGGFRFDQATRSATSFIRDNQRPEVFAADGFISMTFKARFDHFRDKQLVKVSPGDLTSLAWSDSHGQKEVISREDGAWHYAGMEAVDSTRFTDYLATLTEAQGSEFSERPSTDGLPWLEKITLRGNNLVEPAVITAYASQDTASPFLIYSSMNPQAIFKSDSSGLYKRIFSDLRPFRPHGQ